MMELFVVVMHDSDGNIYWISPRRFTCGRCPVPRHDAEVFPSIGNAQAAVDEMPRYFSSPRVRYAIETLNESGAMAISIERSPATEDDTSDDSH
jgi:hypothetical protein